MKIFLKWEFQKRSFRFLAPWHSQSYLQYCSKNNVNCILSNFSDHDLFTYILHRQVCLYHLFFHLPCLSLVSSSCYSFRSSVVTECALVLLNTFWRRSRYTENLTDAGNLYGCWKRLYGMDGKKMALKIKARFIPWACKQSVKS